MNNNNKIEVGQINKVQSAKDTQASKPSTYGTPLPPKTMPKSGK